MTHSVINLYKEDVDKYREGEGHTIEIVKLYSSDLWDHISINKLFFFIFSIFQAKEMSFTWNLPRIQLVKWMI
jgi:hypothetical protein